MDQEEQPELDEADGLTDDERGPRMKIAFCCSCAAIALLVCLIGAIGARNRILRSLNPPERTVVLKAETDDPQVLEDASTVLKKRLKTLWVSHQVRVANGKIEVDLTTADYERLPESFLDGGVLQFMLVAPSDAVAGDQTQYRVFPTLDMKEKEILLQLKPSLAGRDFRSFYRALDGQGRGCVGFTMSVLGRKKLYGLTSNNVGRQMAVVMDGVVRSAPVIRAPIGKKGIIDGGASSWSPEELRQLLALLDGGTLPTRLEVEDVKDIGR